MAVLRKCSDESIESNNYHYIEIFECKDLNFFENTDLFSLKKSIIKPLKII
jgi:hypothetical protein